ncbi:hypothetical protein [Solirubrobacter soli]|uniref:hypothetical protein n=1 Tax=Solirubrobacter soli TaxID=363832 RepID=UPI0004866837|nr:hypothetical protein [Solirubrobacter soli]
MTIWIYGQGNPPYEPDDVGLLHALDLDGNDLVALPCDREFVRPEVLLTRTRDELAVRGAWGDQLRAEIAALEAGSE